MHADAGCRDVNLRLFQQGTVLDCILGLQQTRPKEKKSGKEWRRSGPGGWMGTRVSMLQARKGNDQNPILEEVAPHKVPHVVSSQSVSQSCMYVATTVDVHLHLLRQEKKTDLHPGLAG